MVKKPWRVTFVLEVDPAWDARDVQRYVEDSLGPDDAYDIRPALDNLEVEREPESEPQEVP